MRVTCPACGAENSLDGLIGHDGARAALAELAAISGPLAGAVLRYLALFRPAKSRLSFDRVAGLLAELRPMILDARIERRGRVYPAPRETWIGAIDTPSWFSTSVPATTTISVDSGNITSSLAPFR